MRRNRQKSLKNFPLMGLVVAIIILESGTQPVDSCSCLPLFRLYLLVWFRQKIEQLIVLSVSRHGLYRPPQFLPSFLTKTCCRHQGLYYLYVLRFQLPSLIFLSTLLSNDLTRAPIPV